MRDELWFCVTGTTDKIRSMLTRSVWMIMKVVLVIWLSSPVGADGGRNVTENTPEGVLERYFMALGEGSLKGVRSVYHPPDVAFYLPEPVMISRFVIKRKRVLTRADLAGLDLRVPPFEGDVQLDVFQIREADGQRTYQVLSYWFRLVKGNWKIYAQSAWGN